MSIIDIKCQDSISSSMDCCHIDKQRKALLLCNNYQIYLFFNLPHILCSYYLIQARLILFKLLPCPLIARKTVGASDKYNLYPLLDFFSVYSCMFCPPKIDFSRRVIFDNNYCSSYTEVDITEIVKDWADNKIENKGLLLTGNDNSQYVSYASDRYEIVGMRPLIRMTYEGKEICLPLSVVPCEVEVNG